MPNEAVRTCVRVLESSGYLALPAQGPVDIIGLKTVGSEVDAPDVLLVRCCRPGDRLRAASDLAVLASTLAAGAGSCLELWLVEGGLVRRLSRYGEPLGLVRIAGQGIDSVSN